jgi:hypothetical protein
MTIKGRVAIGYKTEGTFKEDTDLWEYYTKSKYILIATYDCGCRWEAGWTETVVEFFDTLKEIYIWIKKCSIREYCSHTYPCNIQVFKNDGKLMLIDWNVFFEEKYEYMCWNDKCKNYGKSFLTDVKYYNCPKCKKELGFVRRLDKDDSK